MIKTNIMNELAKIGLKPEILAKQRQILRTFDLVYTPSGAIAMVMEVSDYGGRNPPAYSISYFDEDNTRGLNQHNAWWQREDLDLIGNIIPVIAGNLCHPFGSNQKPTYDAWEKSLNV